MSPFRARALEKDFPYGVQPRQRRPGLKNPKRQMPCCRTQLAIFRAPRGVCAPCGLRVPTRKVTATRQRIGPRPATRRLARSPQRRRFPGRPRPHPQSYGDAPANRPPPATRSLARSCERIDSGWKGFPPSQPEASARMPWATSPCSSFSLTLRVPSAYCGVSERNTSPTRQF